MRSFFLGLALLSVAACKQETKITVSTNKSPDSVSLPETNETTDELVLKQLSPAKTAEFLSAKDNDTIYVTNFFATWCGPCMREIPHFREKMEQLKDKPVKFTFINLDQKADWDTQVKDFAKKNNLSERIILLDGETLTPDFYKANFKTWDGGSIPFTIVKKGSQSEEVIGGMDGASLDRLLNSFMKN